MARFPDPIRVVLLGLDGFPHRMISPSLTPNLWRLAQAGGMPPGGGLAELPSTTYPGFASLLTGAHPKIHGVRTTVSQPGTVPGWGGEASVRVPTILHAARDAGLTTAAILGDQKLHPVLRTEPATVRWPPGGVPGPGTKRDFLGYSVNAAVREALVDALRDAACDFVFGHLNESDTLGHLLGPDDRRTIACYASTDAIVSDLLSGLREDWDRSLVIVVSDHDMECRTPTPPIELDGSVVADWIGDGGAAFARLREGASRGAVDASLARTEGVASWVEDGPDVLLVLARPGWIFRSGGRLPPGGFHGGTATQTTVSIVGGGHPAVRGIAAAIRQRRPTLADWGVTVAALLGVSLPHASGIALLPAG